MEEVRVFCSRTFHKFAWHPQENSLKIEIGPAIAIIKYDRMQNETKYSNNRQQLHICKAFSLMV